MACVAASPAGAISALIHMISDLGLRVGLIEPAAASLFRAGAFRARAPRGSMLWRGSSSARRRRSACWARARSRCSGTRFRVEEGQETNSILAAYSTLWMLGRNARISLPIDTVVVHGRPGLTLAQDPEEFRRRTGARLIRCDEPGYGPEAAALGLALADPLSDEPRIDLGRELKPSPTIRDVFPWKELMLNGALVGSISLFLLGTAADAGGGLRAVETELAAFPWAKGMDQAKLEAEKKAIEEQTRAIMAFRNSRVAWSVPLRTIAAAAPENTVITVLSGDAEVETGAGKGPSKAKKQLVISFETPMAGDGSLPREIDGFLASLRGDSSLKRHFPIIEVTALRANPVQTGHRAVGVVQHRLPARGREDPAPRRPAVAPPGRRSEINRTDRRQDSSATTHEPAALVIRLEPVDPEAAQQPPEAPIGALRHRHRGMASRLPRPAGRAGLRHDGPDRPRMKRAATAARSSGSRSRSPRTASSWIR